MLQRQVKRQSTELERIAGARGELPTILHSHNEEVRVLKDKIKRLAQANKDLEVKLDKRDSILLKMKEVNKTLNSLNQNKGFDAKQKMLSDLEELKAQLELRDEENKVSAIDTLIESQLHSNSVITNHFGETDNSF